MLKMIYYYNNLQTRREDGGLVGIYTGIAEPDAYFFADYIIWPNGAIFNIRTGQYLNTHVIGDGYLSVTLINHFPDHTVKKDVLLHRLVAINFIEKTAEDYYYDRNQVNHISGDKTDCSVENLEFANAKENVRHSIHTGLSHIKSYYDVKSDIIEDFRNGMSVKDVYEKYKHTGIKRATLYNYRIEAIGYVYNKYIEAREEYMDKNIESADENMIYSELVDTDFDVTDNTVKHITKRMGYKSDRIDMTKYYPKINQMLSDGLTPIEIANTLGLKRDSVRKYANRHLGIGFKKDNSEIKAEIKEKLANGISVSDIMKEYGNKVGKSTVEEWRRQIFGVKTDRFISEEIKDALIKDIQSGLPNSELYTKYSDKISPRTIRKYCSKYRKDV